MTDWTELLPIIVQTIVIIVAIAAAVKRSERRMTLVENDVEHLKEAVKPIPGISRAVAHLQGKIED